MARCLVPHHGRLGGGLGRASRPLPLGFAGQLATGPAGIGLCIFKRHGHHGECPLAGDVCARPAWVTPLGARHETPPVAGCAGVTGPLRWREHHRPGLQQSRGQARVAARIQGPLGHGDMASGFDKRSKLIVADLGAIDPKARHIHRLRPPFLGVNRIAQAQPPGGYPHHAGCRGLGLFNGQRATQGVGTGSRFCLRAVVKPPPSRSPQHQQPTHHHAQRASHPRRSVGKAGERGHGVRRGRGSVQALN